jgi:pimeloyl-ACP methyl ester carboxylesterase
LAIAHPERLTNLVIIDAGPEMRRPGSSRIRDFVNDSEHLVSVEAIIERALKFNPRRDPTILRRSLMHNLRQQPDGRWKWKYDRRRFQRLDHEARGGESDVFHEEDAERLVARLPNGRHVTIPRAGHTVQGDNPKDLVAELRRFLAGNN